MAGFISALIKQRRDARKAGPDTSGRLKEIVDILRKYDYDDGFTPKIVVGIIQDLGPTFVKIGQIASQQSEHIPSEYCDALAKLRSSVAPMDAETVHAQIQKHLGKPVDELFASFDDKPLGSASIGQVHRAELADGTVVAVKVRRPGVVDTVARDFALIEKILDTFAKDGIGGIDIKALIVGLEKTSKTELDFTNEAANLERFLELNAERARVKSPKCYREFTNEAILTEDFVTGTEASDAAFLDTLDDEERDRLAALVADNFATQILVDGFYHADPHSGNVLINEPEPSELVEEAEDSVPENDEAEAAAAEEAVAADVVAEEAAEEQAAKSVDVETNDTAEDVAEAQEDDVPAPDEADEAADEQDAEAANESAEPAEDEMPLPEHSIEWIDFGMMGVLTTQQRQILIDLVTAIVMQDAYSLKRTVLKTAQPKGEIDHGALLELCEGMCDQYTGGDFGDFELGDLLGTILSSLQDEEYDIDPFLTNLSRGIIAAEGTVKALSPRINILNYFIDKVDAGPGMDLDFSNMDDEQLAALNGPIAMELLKFFDSTSRSSAKTAETLDMLEKGQVRVRTDFSFEEKALGSIDRMVSYVVRALLIIAIIIASSMLCTVPVNAMEKTPFLIAFPVLGSIGYAVGVYFAWALHKDIKKGK